MVIIVGVAELFAGAISMGFGAYLANFTEAAAYMSMVERKCVDVTEQPEDEEQAAILALARYGLSGEAAQLTVEKLKEDETKWVQVWTKTHDDGSKVVDRKMPMSDVDDPLIITPLAVSDGR